VPGRNAALLARNVPVCLAEGRRISGAEIRRRFHASQDHLDAACLRAIRDGDEVVAELLDRQPAKRVVAAERDDQDLDVPLEHPVDPPQPPG